VHDERIDCDLLGDTVTVLRCILATGTVSGTWALYTACTIRNNWIEAFRNAFVNEKPARRMAGVCADGKPKQGNRAIAGTG
jgi:hypothetical protein